MATQNEIQKLILDFMSKDNYEPCRTKEMARKLGISKDQQADFRRAIRDLKHKRKVHRIRGSRWGMVAREKCITGKISITRSGCGFLLPDDPAREDIYIGENNLGAALNGDRVEVIVDSPKGSGYRSFGTVVGIVERASPRFVAIITPDLKAQADDPKNPFTYDIEDAPDGLKRDIKVIMETTNFPGEGQDPSGKVIEILGPAGAADTETAAILEGFKAPGEFPEEVKEEVRNIAASHPMEDRTGRLDMTDLITVTIDPETARDFDDALSIEEKEDGSLIVGVHIADVAHFVKSESKLDDEACDRSTSIYLPGRVIPMLPEELSNDLCSLRPQEERFVKTVFIEYSPDGERKGFHIHRGVIKSRRRMTYPEVKNLLSDEKLAEEFEDKELLKRLELLNSLAHTLRERRMNKGSIELNMPEYVILLTEEGDVEGMELVEHDFSHRLVEDFMLAANICVAEWCHENGMPVLHRVHDAPDEEATEELADFLNASGYIFKKPFKRERLQDVIDKAFEKPEQHAINLAILKSFKQAVYAPDSDIGHFALNFPHYMHFTSPIRRFPDLFLHQTLDRAFSKTGDKLPKKLHKALSPVCSLEKLGEHCSGMERRAMKIEEAVKDFRRLELLNKTEEKEFSAVVTGVRKFGVFVEIENYFVEGMLPRWMVEKLGYTTREKIPGRNTGLASKGFHLGQKVIVGIKKIDLSARVCEMELLKVIES